MRTPGLTSFSDQPNIFAATEKTPLNQRQNTQRQHRQRRDGKDFRSDILSASLACIADKGIARVTHRMIAEKASVPLAATTYHFATKHDIIEAASSSLLQQYLSRLRAGRRKIEGSELDPSSLFALARQVIIRAGDRYATDTLAWLEIILHAGRDKRFSPMAAACPKTGGEGGVYIPPETEGKWKLFQPCRGVI